VILVEVRSSVSKWLW